MFGQRLKSWMETHLGRPRQKSGHQNQKNHRASKDGPCTAASTSVAALSESNSNPQPTENNRPNLESSAASDFSTVSNTSPSNSNVQIQSQSVMPGAQTAQLQKQEQEAQDHPTKDYEEKVCEQEHHQLERTTCTRSSTTGSVSNSGSHNILLGAFCNNLSSPDTGYSTDGYSPKSVYPALSFESGKSTPKSSYTISSLVSSELHLSSSKGTTATHSLSSASCSVNNGLESDSGSPPGQRLLLKTSLSLPPHSETEKCNLGLGDGIGNNSILVSSVTEERQLTQPYAHSDSIKHESNKTVPKDLNPFRSCNDTVAITQCASTKPSVNQVNDFPSHEQTFGEKSHSMVAANHALSNFRIHEDHEEESCKHGFSRISTNPFCNNNGNQFQSPNSPSCLEDNHRPNHRRTESLDERKSTNSEVDREGNSSSKVTASGYRNIRTSFVLVTSQIPECNSFGLKNAFSICSPRKERTRIKTNPWVSFTEHVNDGNSNANNSEASSDMRLNSSCSVHGTRSVAGESGDKATMMQYQLCKGRCTCTGSHSVNETHNSLADANKKTNEVETPNRISTSISTSDSGKGSLDFDSGTNRNSTESSCVLSDSASTRNSIISQEVEVGSSPTSSIGSASYLAKQTLGEEEHHHQQSPQCSTSSSQVKVGNKIMAVSSESPKNSPASVKRAATKIYNNNNNTANEYSHQEDQDPTSTSITLPPELITTTTSVSAQTNVIMVDKETDILSDWANTDEDGDDEIETDKNDEDDQEERRVTPTISSPDTDTGGRATFHISRSNSSVTDIDFGDSSGATAATSTRVVPSSSIFRHHYTQNPYKHLKGNGSVATNSYRPSPNTMNPDTICYQSVPIQVKPVTGPRYHKGSSWNQSEVFVPQQTIIPSCSPSLESDTLSFNKSGLMRPMCRALGIPTANISLSSLYSNASEANDYNTNKPQRSSSSTAIARGALGFLRKIFKKSSCSSSRASPRSDKRKMSRSTKSKDSHLDNIASITGLRSAADALVSPHPLIERKQSINGYFLTPTPNAFRRRTTGIDSSESKSCSKHYKPVKTDIIRLPSGGALSPTHIRHTGLRNSTSSASSSQTTGSSSVGGAFKTPSYSTGSTNNSHHGHNANTNSTASSIHSMSTSTSISCVGESHVNGNTSTRRENQSRLNDQPYSNSNSSRQSPFTTAEDSHSRCQVPSLSPLPRNPAAHNPKSSFHCCETITSQMHVSHQSERDFSSGGHRPCSRSTPVGPYPSYEQSPRLQNPQHRINSPSFNNYSPIHRLVVTGGNHLLSRGPPSSQHQQQPDFLHSESPRPPPRQSSGLSHHNRNVEGVNGTPNINRPHSNVGTLSPLINHHNQFSVSSPRPLHLPSANTFTSPSPVLRNPRYQYITSSNQNSPVLNVPKRMNVPVPNPPVPPSNQHYYHNNHNQGPFPNGPKAPSLSTFSPKPPSRQDKSSNHNPFSAASPNMNHHQLHIELNQCLTNSRQQHISGNYGFGGEFNEDANNTRLNPRQSVLSSVGNPTVPGRIQTYQPEPQQPLHYYASPVVPRPTSQPQFQQRLQAEHGGTVGIPIPMHPTTLNFNEPPLLMKAHLHNQNVRLNNFLKSKQRHRENALRHSHPFPNSQSAQERIYETVDSGDDEENNKFEDLVELNNHAPLGNRFYSTNTNGRHQEEINRLPTSISNQESDLHFPNKGNNPAKYHTSKSQRSKKEESPLCQRQPRPPVPMVLFGPNTFLSETETMLLEADREADLKYKRLINEAEALLKEITAVQSHQKAMMQPWVYKEKGRLLRVEDCPQSDPLRRKAYDCWALRRLQQELAGCCASPPVLHRSRMNLQSPSTPTAAIHPYFSLVPNTQITTLTDNQNQNSINL